MQPEIRSFALLLRSPVNSHHVTVRRMRTVSKSATFLATESVNSAPFKRGKTEVQIFWKGKAQNSSPILRCTFLARRSANLIANFRATMVTSLPSFSLSVSLSLSLSHRMYLTHNIGSASALPFALLLRSPVNSHHVTVRRMRTVSKSATFLATESVNSAPFKRGKTEVQIFWKGKAQNSSPILRCTFLARRSANLIANFRATMVTSLPSFSLSVSLSLSLTECTSRTI